jgi:HSP20 family protein
MIELRFAPLREMQNRLDQMGERFAQLYGQGNGNSGPQFHPNQFPPLNAWEDEQNLYVEAELPGLGLEDLEIYVPDPQSLTIKGQRKDLEPGAGRWHRRERALGAFERTLPLPTTVAADEVEACLKHGVLTVTLPKAPEARPRKIEVRAASPAIEEGTKRRKSAKKEDQP